MVPSCVLLHHPVEEGRGLAVREMQGVFVMPTIQMGVIRPIFLTQMFDAHGQNLLIPIAMMVTRLRCAILLYSRPAVLRRFALSSHRPSVLGFGFS